MSASCSMRAMRRSRRRRADHLACWRVRRSRRSEIGASTDATGGSPLSSSVRTLIAVRPRGPGACGHVRARTGRRIEMCDPDFQTRRRSSSAYDERVTRWYRASRNVAKSRRSAHADQLRDRPVLMTYSSPLDVSLRRTARQHRQINEDARRQVAPPRRFVQPESRAGPRLFLGTLLAGHENTGRRLRHRRTGSRGDSLNVPRVLPEGASTRLAR